jgi:hypothetical protein
MERAGHCQVIGDGSGPYRSIHGCQSSGLRRTRLTLHEGKDGHWLLQGQVPPFLCVSSDFEVYVPRFIGFAADPSGACSTGPRALDGCASRQSRASSTGGWVVQVHGWLSVVIGRRPPSGRVQGRALPASLAARASPPDRSGPRPASSITDQWVIRFFCFAVGLSDFGR